MNQLVSWIIKLIGYIGQLGEYLNIFILNVAYENDGLLILVWIESQESSPAYLSYPVLANLQYSLLYFLLFLFKEQQVQELQEEQYNLNKLLIKLQALHHWKQSTSTGRYKVTIEKLNQEVNKWVKFNDVSNNVTSSLLLFLTK